MVDCNMIKDSGPSVGIKAGWAKEIIGKDDKKQGYPRAILMPGLGQGSWQLDLMSAQLRS